MVERHNNLKKSDSWKIQLTLAINFISSKGTNEERVKHSKIGKNIVETIKQI